MKIKYQWALKNPNSWQEIDSSKWHTLPKRPIPKKEELGGIDDIPGWVRNVNIQGITTEGYDHIAIEEISIGNDPGVKMTVWNDDVDDLVPGNEPQAIIWTILPLAPDPKHGMAINTRQSCVRYDSGEKYLRLVNNPPQNTTVRPWNEFNLPDENITRHGVWIEDSKLAEHIIKAPHAEWGWIHWNEHLPDNEVEIISGRRELKEQRKQGRYKQAEHTITYYQRSTARAQGWVTASNEDAAELTTAASSTQTTTLNATNVLAWSWATPANQPNSADWPSGTFHAQYNCTAISAGDTYGGVAASKVTFHRLSANLATNIDFQSGDGNFSGTGLKLENLQSPPWDSVAGTATDVYAVILGAVGTTHGDTITLTLNTTDSYIDGPWTAVPSATTGNFLTFF